jgi:hypothetical protein
MELNKPCVTHTVWYANGPDVGPGLTDELTDTDIYGLGE